MTARATAGVTRALLLAACALDTLMSPAGAGVPTRTTRQSRPRLYDVSSTVPVFRQRTPLARFADRALADWAAAEERRFIAEARQDAAEGGHTFGTGGKGWGYDLDVSYARALGPRLISVGLVQTEDTGGAHPNSYQTAFNFGLIRGRPRRLTLGDFFRPGTPWRGRVPGLILAKLRRDPRASFVDGKTKVSEAQLAKFVVEGRGLRFCFDPYEFGSHAAGPIDVALSARELSPDFRLPR